MHGLLLLVVHVVLTTLGSVKIFILTCHCTKSAGINRTRVYIKKFPLIHPTPNATMSVNEVKLRKAEVEFEVRGTGHVGSRTFALGDEDHTLGNALRHVLIQNQKIAFAGYSVPHPSEPVVHLRIQTAKGSAEPGSGGRRWRSQHAGGEGDDMDVDEGGHDTRMPAVDALKEACHTLSDQCDFVISALEEALPEVEADREHMEKLALSGAQDEYDEEDEDDE